MNDFFINFASYVTIKQLNQKWALVELKFFLLIHFYFV